MLPPAFFIANYGGEGHWRNSRNLNARSSLRTWKSCAGKSGNPSGPQGREAARWTWDSPSAGFREWTLFNGNIWLRPGFQPWYAACNGLPPPLTRWHPGPKASAAGARSLSGINASRQVPRRPFAFGVRRIRRRNAEVFGGIAGYRDSVNVYPLDSLFEKE